LEEYFFGGGGCPACYFYPLGQSLPDKLMLGLFLIELLDHKILGNFFEFPHKMKKAIACFFACYSLYLSTHGQYALAKFLHLRVANILYL